MFVNPVWFSLLNSVADRTLKCEFTQVFPARLNIAEIKWVLGIISKKYHNVGRRYIPQTDHSNDTESAVHQSVRKDVWLQVLGITPWSGCQHLQKLRSIKCPVLNSSLRGYKVTGSTGSLVSKCTKKSKSLVPFSLYSVKLWWLVTMRSFWKHNPNHSKLECP